MNRREASATNSFQSLTNIPMKLRKADGMCLFFLVLVLWILVFLPVVPDMFRTWLSHTDNMHGFFVPFIALYFAWRKKEQLAEVELNGSLWGGLLLIASLAFYLLSYIGGIQVVSRLMIVSSLIGLIWNCYGWQVVRLFLFPLGFLFFMVPVPVTLVGVISFPLQMMATNISARFLEFISIPVYQEGNLLYFAQVQLEIAEACSGIRSIVALLMLAVLMTYFSCSHKIFKILLVLCSVPVAMLANILRVILTGLLAHNYGGDVARSFLHGFSGLVVFLLGFGLLVLLLRLFDFIDSRQSIVAS